MTMIGWFVGDICVVWYCTIHCKIVKTINKSGLDKKKKWYFKEKIKSYSLVFPLLKLILLGAFKQIKYNTSEDFVKSREQMSNFLNSFQWDVKYNRPFISKSNALKMIWFYK